MTEEKPQRDPDGFVDGVRTIKYDKGYGAFDFEIHRTDAGERVVHKGVEGPEYLRINTGWAHNVMVGGKLGYSAINHNKKTVMNFDSIEGPEYNYIDCPLVGIEGKLLYLARNENGAMVANFDNSEGKEYFRAFIPANIAGKPAYHAQICEKGPDGKFRYPWVVVFEGVEGPKYQRVWSSMREVHGKLAYLAEPDDSGELVLNFDGVEFENRYGRKPVGRECKHTFGEHTFVVDGKDLVSVFSKWGGRITYDGKKTQHSSFLHFLIDHELAKREK